MVVGFQSLTLEAFHIELTCSAQKILWMGNYILVKYEISYEFVICQMGNVKFICIYMILSKKVCDPNSFWKNHGSAKAAVFQPHLKIPII